MNTCNHSLSSPCQNKGKEMVDSQSQIEVRYSSHHLYNGQDSDPHVTIRPLWNDSSHYTDYDYKITERSSD